MVESTVEDDDSTENFRIRHAALLADLEANSHEVWDARHGFQLRTHGLAGLASVVSLTWLLVLASPSKLTAGLSLVVQAGTMFCTWGLFRAFFDEERSTSYYATMTADIFGRQAMKYATRLDRMIEDPFNARRWLARAGRLRRGKPLASKGQESAA